ncbi:MAG: hypothetical protein HC940_06415 [Acaryochloris sp. SU_5_25]|nr:hypothetical protein [Acaryochloris sp. SU_5_25]
MSSAKAWSREAARDRYVVGDRITHRELAKLSGRSLSTIGAWSKAADWPQQREQVQSKIGAKNLEKLIEQTTDEFAQAAERTLSEHLETYDGLLCLCSRFISDALSAMASDPNPEIRQRLDEFCKVAGRSPLMAAISGITAAVEGQRKILHLDEIQDMDKLRRWLNSQGYDLITVLPDGSKQLLPSVDLG